MAGLEETVVLVILRYFVDRLVRELKYTERGLRPEIVVDSFFRPNATNGATSLQNDHMSSWMEFKIRPRYLDAIDTSANNE